MIFASLLAYPTYYIKKLLHKLIGHTAEVYGVALTNDQDIKAKKIASCSGDATIKIWSLEQRCLLFELKNHQDSVNSVKFSYNGDRIISGSSDNTVRIWKIQKNNNYQ